MTFLSKKRDEKTFEPEQHQAEESAAYDRPADCARLICFDSSANAVRVFDVSLARQLLLVGLGEDKVEPCQRQYDAEEDEPQQAGDEREGENGAHKREHPVHSKRTRSHGSSPLIQLQI